MNETTSKALLSPVPPAGEEARVKAVLDNIEAALSFVPDGVRLYSISPPLLETFVGNIGYFMEHPRLRGELVAMIRYLVSSDANCRFCIDLNEGFLVNMGLDHDEVQAARNNADKAPLPNNEKSLLKLALKAVNDPDGISKEEIESVKAQGWSERDVFDATAAAANNRAFNYMLKTFKVHQQGVFA